METVSGDLKEYKQRIDKIAARLQNETAKENPNYNAIRTLFEEGYDISTRIRELKFVKAHR